MEFTAKEYRLARDGARNAISGSRRKNLVENEDLVSEAYMWLVTHPSKVLKWREEGRKGEGKIALSCQRACLRGARQGRVHDPAGQGAAASG